jgi:hypothetical protein
LFLHRGILVPKDGEKSGYIGGKVCKCYFLDGSGRVNNLINPSGEGGKWIMAKYIALHTFKKSAEEFSKVLSESAAEFARATTSGETPARCIKSWNPVPYGRTDYMFCLWEADKPEDIEASLGPALDYLTLDAMQVDEIDWEQVAKAGS